MCALLPLFLLNYRIFLCFCVPFIATFPIPFPIRALLTLLFFEVVWLNFIGQIKCNHLSGCSNEGRFLLIKNCAALLIHYKKDG